MVSTHIYPLCPLLQHLDMRSQSLSTVSHVASTIFGRRRWDLHHAIVSHGGYTAVARELGRQTCSRLPESFFRLGESSKYAFPEMLIAAVRKVMEEKNLTKLPSIRDFKQMVRPGGGSSSVLSVAVCRSSGLQIAWGRGPCSHPTSTYLRCFGQTMFYQSRMLYVALVGSALMSLLAA